ncbi:hypothetical protein [Actinoplanes aureus]|uniref:Uncharacterized protein n=1 Tax=Actinoplanes aureus TaxID=2792083 RepID=A0A931CEM8_9ACTN|nr:hypothetical protein [Actinoplanes aureus]MBG0567199.1 hypothetical protein [Actinoplanes aureus]
MDGKLSFWLGLVLAIPLSIAANLVTPPVSRLVARYNARWDRRLILKSARLEAVSSWMGENPDKFSHYAAMAIPRVLRSLVIQFLTAAIIALGIVLIYLADVSDPIVQLLIVLPVAYLLYENLALLDYVRRLNVVWAVMRARNGWPVYSDLSPVKEEPVTALREPVRPRREPSR